MHWAGAPGKAPFRCTQSRGKVLGVSWPRLHLLPLFPSVLHLVPLYASNEGCWQGGPALT